MSAPIESESHASTPERSPLTVLTRPERVKALKAELGFYPHSNEEMGRIINLMGRDGQQNPALRHLDEIYAHQRTHKADAPEALRSVVRGFEEYAGNALNEIEYMDGFSKLLQQTKPNQLSGFGTVFPTPEWEHDGTLRATFTAMARYIETSALAETEEGDRLGKRELIDLTSGKDRIARINETLGGLRISSLEKTAQAVATSQAHRLEYWTGQLEASRQHFFVREAASIALQELSK